MDFILVKHLFAFIFSTLLALYIVPILIKMAFRFNILDVPDGKIKNHEKATPYLGGFVVYIPLIVTLAIVFPFENHILWLFLGVTILLFIGFIDDLKILKPSQKFFGQFLAMICFLKGGFSLKTNFFSDILNVFTSGFWILSIINAFNLVDVMDGLATLLAIMATTTFLILAILFQSYETSLLLIAFLGPLLVFFIYNKPPAKIYLGDTGSLVIGGFLSAIPFILPWSSKSFDAYYAPIIILGVPSLEIFSLIIIRTWIGIPFFKGSPHHFSIYLRKKGWSVKKILRFSACCSFILSLIAISFVFGYLSFYSLLLLGITFLSAWSFFIFF